MSRGHYFDPEPASTPHESARTVELMLPDGAARLRTDRGVFSAERIDPGTRLLLGTDLRPSGAAIVDLGCGYGPIAVTLARRAPGATIWAVDTNARARSLCGQNAEELGVHNVRVVAPDEIPPSLVIDEIWSNPPIRIGKQPLQELLSGWLNRLTPHGRAVLVVQRHLGADSLAAWLVSQNWNVSRVLSRQAYRVMEVRRRDQPAPH